MTGMLVQGDGRRAATGLTVEQMLRAGVKAVRVGKKVYDKYRTNKDRQRAAKQAGTRKLPNTKGGTETARVGKRKLGRLPRKRKARKVDKQFAEKVKTVIDNVNKGVVNTSTFRKYWDMILKPKGNVAHASGPLKTLHTGCDWFGGDRSGTMITFVRQFTPFNTLELLDAVSVMYNGKVSHPDYTKTIGNFGTKDLKVRFPYMSCSIQFVNCTDMDGTLDVYECVCKFDTIEDVSSALNSHKTVTQLSVAPEVSYANTKLLLSRYAKISDFPINSMYSVKKTSHKFNRNGKISIFTKETDVYVDFEERLTENGAFANYQKGHKQYIVEFRPNIGYLTSSVRSIGNAVRYYPDGLADELTKTRGVAVTFDRTFTVDQPTVCNDLYEGSRVVVQDLRTTPYDESTPDWYCPNTQNPNIDLHLDPIA